MNQLIRTDLIIVDDIGLLPVSPDAAEGFYRLVDAAYERRTLAVSSNLHPDGFGEVLPKILATATVDRLLHDTHVVVTQDDSSERYSFPAAPGVAPPYSRRTTRAVSSLAPAGGIRSARRASASVSGSVPWWRVRESASRARPVSMSS